MKLIKYRLKHTAGYTMTELALSIALVAIAIIPIYQMILGGAKIQRAAEQNYQASLCSQVLLQSVTNQIEEDLEEAYKASRALAKTDVKPWLRQENQQTHYLVTDFLGPDQKQDDLDYYLAGYSCEVGIWDLQARQTDRPMVFLSHGLEDEVNLDKDNLFRGIKVEIKEDQEKYFKNHDYLLWPSLGKELRPVGIGEISHDQENGLKIRAQGIKGQGIHVDRINEYGNLEDQIKLSYQSIIEELEKKLSITHELLIEAHRSPLKESEIIQLSLDLTSFPVDEKSQIIRVENKTKATLIISVYDEENLGDIDIYPLGQTNEKGNIILEKKDRFEPEKNFVIGIIIKKDNKILSKLVDVYAYDYNKR